MSEETEHVHSRCICCEASDAIRKNFSGLSAAFRTGFRTLPSVANRIPERDPATLLDERIEHLGQTPHKGTRVVVE